MRRKSLLIILITIISGLYLQSNAQENFRTGYFLDGYTYKYKMNPAFQGERNFVAMPILGNLSVGAQTPLGLSTFLHPKNDGSGQLATFMHSSVDDARFMASLRNNNIINANVNLNLMSAGFRVGKSYHTIDFGIRADVDANIPKSLFQFLKAGGSDGTTNFNISNIGLSLSSRLELAYGYSREVTDWLNVGARIKLLYGVVSAEMKMDKMEINATTNAWDISSQGSFSISGLSFNTKGESGNATSSDEQDFIDFTSLETDAIMSRIFAPKIGLAFDLGMTAEFAENFTASFSVIDLGFINWSNMLTAKTPTMNIHYTGMSNLSDSGSTEEFGEVLLDMFNFEETSESVSKTPMLAATLHLGLEYRMPFYERLSVGLLATQKIKGAYSWTEGRLAVNVAPLNWLSFSTTYAYSNFGHSWGAAMNIHTNGFNLYLGTDSLLPVMSLTPQSIPINAINTNISLGINFPFGKYNGRFK